MSREGRPACGERIVPLPQLIEILPLTRPVRAAITVPGSKSITNRALVLAALGEGTTTLRGALWSEDTQVMVEALRALGFTLDVRPDAEEFSNRTITVTGLGGRIPRAGTAAQPWELFVGNAGTAARFLSALVCLGQGVYRLSGVPRMHERPQAALFAALRELGYRVEAANDRLPATIVGAGPRPGASCAVSIEESSQFASALLLAGARGGWQVKVVGENAEESPYVAMTSQLMAAFPERGGSFGIEPDASSGSYFWAANELSQLRCSSPPAVPETGPLDWPIHVSAWPSAEMQIDARFPDTLKVLAIAGGAAGAAANWAVEVSRRDHLGDAIMTAIALAPLVGAVCRFTDLGRLRLQECERVVALRTELTKCGARIEEEGDTLTVHPSPLRGAEIETCDDHRMAMCFATLALKVPGMKIKYPACVKKTFPSFFQKLAAEPPHGLGAIILQVATGQRLVGSDLLPE